MKALILQHVFFEGPALIGDRLLERGISLETVRLWENRPLPSPEGFGLLVVMGGPMSVHDQDAFPWMKAEKAFIAEWLSSGKPALGVCLGAQLFAEALGAEVFDNKHSEIGWFPLRVLRDDGAADAGETVFHWHGETFGIPRGAARIAESDACENQGFRLGRALALQFHVEVTPESVALMVKHCGGELVPAPYVQSAEEMTRRAPEQCPRANGLLGEYLASILDSEGRNP